MTDDVEGSADRILGVDGERAGRTAIRVAFAGAAVVFAAFQLLLWDHVPDDAYITFRYVDRFLGGQGLTFNDAERVEGFSHPLWLLLLSAGARVSGLSVAVVARTAGVVSTLLTFASLLWLGGGRSVRDSEVKWTRVLTLGLLLVFPGTHVYASSGLETPFLGLLLTSGTLIGLAGRTRVAAVSFGLAGITRPEGLAYGALWLALTSRRPLSVRGTDAARAGIIAAPAVLYEAFRIVYFGSWVPNTVWAKPPGTFGGLFGLDTIGQGLAAAGGVAVAGLVLLLRTDANRKLFRQLSGPILASVLLVLYSGGDWMPFGRFLAPVWPLVTLALAHFIFDLTRALPRRTRALGARGTVAALGVLVALSTLGAYAPDLLRYAGNVGLTATLMRGEDQLAVGRWLDARVAPGSTVVTSRLGGMSYAAPELTFWDERGLTDREQALWIARGRPGGDAASPVFLRHPDVVAALAVPADWSYTKNDFLSALLQSEYDLVQTFPQGSYGEVHIWIRRTSDVRL